MNVTIRTVFRGLSASTLALATACTTPLDLDMRGNFDQFSTAEAARLATTDRPRPDNRGVISYPNYQVAVARRGDSVTDVAERVGTDPAALARHNGLKFNDPLRAGEVLSLPSRVAEPSPETGALSTGPILPDPEPTAPSTDIASIAGGALNRAGDRRVETTPLTPADPAAAPAARAKATASKPRAQTGKEPERHKVVRGETAYTIARLYKVPVKALGEWNGLDSEFSIREGQYLLIPVKVETPQVQKTAAQSTEAPGVGSPTPLPPSAVKPLPDEKTKPVAKAAATTAPVADIGQQTAKKAGRMAYPVKGNIVRDYAKGRNDGIDIAAAAGTAIGAAEAGEVAAITSDAEGNHVVVVRHDGKLLTIYSNVTGIKVKEKQKVSRGQAIAEIPSGKSTYVHFEVRKGLESTDPLPYLN
ncbi:LysM peptidoglycan-binding domain-containing protein [Pseudooceanicola sp.]|uniref:LysM peptidoglycan-binding domain-containing protein n=1 Tax=Pseudooceanicola sp. TaxID=1914328 RepID=UPI00262D8E6D|nr:LysM peptidoglycan-binding domain-containing protein [Pseudooceanicola sp.]MDF1855584.1 peptidoglycan DD-metalloendopeptidase family protein [Pseudooceanicola sp.]